MVKVSILCPTFNHEKFIRQALESFLMQKTSFDFEVIVHDDASTDKTADIIKEFQEKYPSVIRPIFQEENQFSKGNYGMITETMIPKSSGVYFIICEGDDYFDDINKLQIQADFLDSNPEYSMCFHPARMFFEKGEMKDSVYPQILDSSKFTVENLLKENFMLTNSVMYRKLEYKNFPPNIVPGDWYMHLFHAKFGKIGFINRNMSSYRRHAGGSWWNSFKNPDELFIKYGISHLEMYYELLRLYSANSQFKVIIMDNIFELLEKIDYLDEKYGTVLMNTAHEKFSSSIIPFVDYFENGNYGTKKLKYIIKERENEISMLKDQIKNLSKERKIFGLLKKLLNVK